MVYLQRSGSCGEALAGESKQGWARSMCLVWRVGEEKGGPYGKRPFSRAELDFLVFIFGPNIPVSHL